MVDKSKIIPIACDHAAFALKEYIKEKLSAQGFELKDFGAYSEERVDYPDMAHPLASAINKGEFERGIIMCGSGNGIAMTANKYPGVRAGLCWNAEQAELTRLHNNANIISLPGRFIDFEEALKAVLIFLNTEFEGGRHQQRVEKIGKIQA